MTGRAYRTAWFAAPVAAATTADTGRAETVSRLSRPLEPAGGTAALKALGAPLSDLTFCPTGGISAANAASYLALPNVAAVGGSWVAPAKLVAAGDWAAITALAREASALRS